MTLRLLQNLVYQVADIIENEVGITDETGLILACSDESKVGEVNLTAAEIANEDEAFIVRQSTSFLKVCIKNKLEYIIYLNSDGNEAFKYLSLISVNLINVKKYYDDRFNRSSLIKDIIAGDIESGDIVIKAKELRIPYNAFRAVFLIKTEKAGDIHPYEVVHSLFPNKSRDFVVAMDDKSIVLVKELKNSDDFEGIDKTAKSVVDTLNAELMIKVVVGVGTLTNCIKDIGRSYREAQTAIRIGNIFDSDKPVMYYDNLGIGRLIYQMPLEPCKLFLEEVFKGESFEALDAETILTIQKFFENNLNVSETSRQLYVHRNTLVYRLNKIQKITGLDLTTFEDAIVLKVSMMVKKYIDKMEKR